MMHLKRNNILKKETILCRFKDSHGDVYDYSLLPDQEYIPYEDKVNILCKKHGMFLQRVSHHIKGNGCPECHFSQKRKTKECFVAEAEALYGSKNSYDEVAYINNSTKVKVGCTKHNHTFYQTPKKHLLGEGCSFCVKENQNIKKGGDFVKRASTKYNGKFDYSEVNYGGSKEDITVICPTHGKQITTPYNHLKGAGCYHCGKEEASKKKSSNNGNKVLSRLNKLYEGRYDLSKASYRGYNDYIEVGCPVHGFFKVTPAQFEKGLGCSKCLSYDGKDPTEYFIQRCIDNLETKYDYSLTVFTHSDDYIDVICPVHGVWSVKASAHLHDRSGCPSCANSVSRTENKIKDFLVGLSLSIEQSNRKLIKPLELDIIIPEKKIAIEYNGIRWHSEKFGKDKNYHLNKTQLCKEQGYRLIHIWEDDYNRDPERELNFLRHTLGCSDTETIYARKTTLKEVDKKEAKEFLDAYHIQGGVGASSFIGAYLEDKLVSVTAFTYKDNKSYVELVRHVNHGDYNVTGSLGKATKYFSKICDLDIISFCDLSRFDGKSYEKAGFIVDKILPPDYKYVVGDKRDHKFNWRKKNIKSKLPEVYDESLTEKEMMELADIPRIWDCGKIRYIHKRV